MKSYVRCVFFFRLFQNFAYDLCDVFGKTWQNVVVPDGPKYILYYASLISLFDYINKFLLK